MCILQAIDGLKPELTIYWYIYIYTKAILGSAVPGISGYITYNHIKLRAPYPNLWGFCHHGLAHLYRQLHPFLFQPPFRYEGLPTCKSPDFCAVNLISPCHVWLPKAISYSSLHPYLPSSKRRQMWNTHHLQMMFLGNPWVFLIFCVFTHGGFMPQYWVAPFMADSSHVRYTVKGLNFHQTPCSLAKTPGCSGVPAVCCFMVSFSKECQPLINKPLGCLIGRVPFKYLIMAIDYWRSTPLINKPWFINPGLTLLYIYIHIPWNQDLTQLTRWY